MGDTFPPTREMKNSHGLYQLIKTLDSMSENFYDPLQSSSKYVRIK